MAKTKKSKIARSFGAATRLGHERVDLKRSSLSSKEINNGIHFHDEGRRPGAICFLGLCDPETKERLVGYYDSNGNCNRFVKVSC